MDLEDRIILIYCVCDDALKALYIADDKQCKMATSEVMTTALVAACYQYGNILHTREFLLSQGFIPRMLSTSQLYRRWHRIPEEVWQVVMLLLASSLRAQEPSNEYVVDSFPVPACQPYRSRTSRLYSGKRYLGFCKSKRLHYYGLKVRLVVDKFGTIVLFSLSPASQNDVRALTNSSLHLPPDSYLYGDKAYTSYHLEDMLCEYEGVKLLPLRKANLKRQHSYEMARKITSTRWIVETSISGIQGLFPKAMNVRTARGFELKMVMFILAKSARDYIRRFAGA